MRISDWSSDVCSSDLAGRRLDGGDSRSLAVGAVRAFDRHHRNRLRNLHRQPQGPERAALLRLDQRHLRHIDPAAAKAAFAIHQVIAPELRSEEHTSELQSLMRISYAVFCLKKKINSHSM